MTVAKEEQAVSREELATKVDVTDWFALRAHLERGAVIVVDSALELADVGARVAADDIKTMEGWVSSGLITKPTAQQIEQWDAEKDKRFLCLIISPFVLVQEEPTVKH